MKIGRQDTDQSVGFAVEHRLTFRLNEPLSLEE